MFRLRKLIVLFLLPLAGFAQKEEWDTYLAHYDKGIGSTSLNMGLKEVAPIGELPIVAVVGVRFRECTTQGLPTDREFIRLSIIFDSIKAHVDSCSRKNQLAGSFTYQCGRADYYYLKDTSRIRKEVLGLLTRQFPGYIPYFVIRPDPEWKDYLQFLYPSQAIQEYMADQKSVMKLQEAGDSLVKPRKVIHWAYFKTKGDLECFGRYAVSRKFKVTRMENTSEPSHPYRIQIVRIDRVDLDSISSLTVILRKQAGLCQGEYGGWETEVVK